jgi:hypothetical protein
MKHPLDPQTARDLLELHQGSPRPPVDTKPDAEPLLEDDCRPDRDERDPYGNLETDLIHAIEPDTARPGADQHDREERFKRQNEARFAALYEKLLAAGGADPNAPPAERQHQILEFLKRQNA